MKFSYRLTKKDYQKIIYERNKRINIIYLLISSLIYLISTINLIVQKNLLVFIIFVIYVLVMSIFLFILNKVITNVIVKINENMEIKYGIYRCSLKNNYFIEELEDYRLECDFNNLRKIKYRKNSIELFPKDKLIVIVFKKELFVKSEDYDKLVTILKEKVSISK